VLKEIQALRVLMHPCVVRLVGVNFTMFNVQLYLQKHDTTLHQYLAQRPSEAQVVQITISLLKGLAHMHATGYMHRDLKTNNILVDRQPLAAVIADLGSVGFGETSRDVVTTLLVRAPEIMCGHPFRKASDIWSLGCILAQTEQRNFLDAWAVADAEKQERAAEFVYMWGLAKKLCPKGLAKTTDIGSKCAGLGHGILTLGHLEAGALGKRFVQPTFRHFMGKLLNFQATGRETAENLLQHTWLQTQGTCQPLAAAPSSRHVEPWGACLAKASHWQLVQPPMRNLSLL
jgi:serine/threonine protein kinase